MRPIRLEIQAFGPYAENQPLEMDQLGEKGIYAIIGETGAGKTTIFDAIVYALYGTGSGEDRSDGKALRAAAARPDLETKVELEFMCGGKTYTIIRKPTQTLTGKRKKEPVEYSGSVVLIMPDGTRLTNSGEIDGTRGKPGIIEQDILGVTKDQFCQTVMIAQGEFRKLLRAKTDERTEILRRIFRTQRFDALSRHMDRLCKEKWAELSESRRQVSFSLKAMRTPGGTPLSETLEALKDVKPEELLLQDATALAAEITRTDDAELTAARDERGRAEAARDLAKQTYDRAIELQTRRKLRSELAEQLGRQKSDLENARQRHAEAEARQPEIKELGEQIVADSLLLPKYSELEKLENERRQTKDDLGRAEAKLLQATGKEAGLKQEEEALIKEAASLAGAGERRIAAMQALRDAQERGKLLDGLEKRVRERDEAARILERSTEALTEAAGKAKAADSALEALIRERDALGNTAQTVTRLEGEMRELDSKAEEIAELKRLTAALRTAQSAYDGAQKAFNLRKTEWEQAEEEARRMRTCYNASIAGLMASELQEGMACPVCGSRHHPVPAALAEDSATEDEVKEAERRAKAAGDAYNEQAVTCSGKKETADGLRRQLAKLLEDIPETEWPGEAETRAQANQRARKQLEEELKAARQADLRFRELQKAEPGARHDAETAKADMHNTEAEVRTAGGKLETAKKEITAAAAELMPDDWTELDLSDAVAESSEHQKSHQRAVRQAEDELKRSGEIESRRTALTEEQRNTAGEIRTLESERSGLSTRLEERSRSCAALREELPWATAADCSAAIAKKEQRRNELEDAIRSSAKDAEELERAIAGTEGQIKTLDADLTGAPEEDAGALQAEYQARQAEYEAADRRKSAAEGLRQNNAEHRKTLEAQAEKALKLEHEHRVMQEVADTANGRVKGEDKLTLETYVQTAYFDRIIAYANRRLSHMSRQQYDLARQTVGEGSKQGKTGLGLDVVDHVIGQRRAVGTLSGGEGFLAALSFALGLSDAIQDSAASAVQLDSMFVDEGFGSLSENYLSLVMDELNDTANEGHRLIGIISHVDEVKADVDRRIEVVKSDSGISKASIL